MGQKCDTSVGSGYHKPLLRVYTQTQGRVRVCNSLVLYFNNLVQSVLLLRVV